MRFLDAISPMLLLRDVAESDEPALQTALERLADADLLFVEGAPPQANYRFKHALIQDAAYDSLLKSRRQALHRRAAEVLRDQPEPAAAEPEADRPSFHRSRARRAGNRMVGQGRRPGPAPLRLPGGDRPSRQGDRDGGRGSGWKGGGRALASGNNYTPPMATLSSRREDRARRKRRELSPEPASRLEIRTRSDGWRLTTAFGSAASLAASCRR